MATDKAAHNGGILFGMDPLIAMDAFGPAFMVQLLEDHNETRRYRGKSI